jgi:hypothetical protein
MKKYIGMFFAMMLSNAIALTDEGVYVAGVATDTTMGKVTFTNIDKDGIDTNVLALQRGNVTYKSSTTLGANTLSAKVKFKF